MLQKVRLINYRGLKDTTIPLAPVTLLTGTNGIGKTSVLEGLYFLLSPQVPDAAVFPRYQTLWQIQANLAVPNGLLNTQFPFLIKGYDYSTFWRECPTSGASECKVESFLGNLKLSWKMKMSDFSEMDPELKNIAAAYGLQSGIGSPYALWEWGCMGKAKKGNSHELINVNHKSKAVQQLSMEPRFSPRIGDIISTACRYVDMSSARHIPNKLSLQTENLLTDALKIINPDVTGVRHDGNQSRLRVIINNESEFSLGTLGVGAETWASMLLVLAELVSTKTVQASVIFLADEIGAGIHYSKLEEMWEFLLKFQLKYPQIQMVLTTHSHDCIGAFCKAFQSANPGTAHIVRLHKFDDEGGVQTTVYPHEAFASILSGEWEVRG
jgi:energy-coupling factor transporter ATP-binding protein EcfA2